MSGEIQLEELTKAFGEHVAVAGISVDMPAGEFFTLLGPSGCGKTTTLRMIAGFEQPTSGRIMLDGSDVARVPPHRRNVNTVFQSYALFPHMSVAENVAFGLEMQNAPKALIDERVREALEMVRLEGFAARRPAQLSGGQQQRVAVARALAPKPSVLLLDEPLSALDLKLRKGMQSELKRLQRETGITFVLVTHDQEEALAMSDRIAVMRSGDVLQVGTPRDIYDNPQDRFVADFIGESNLLPGAALGRDPAKTIVVRPEHIVVSPVADGTKGHATGAVSAITFLGSDTLYEVVLEEGAKLHSRSRGVAALATGDKVVVDWARHLERELAN